MVKPVAGTAREIRAYHPFSKLNALLAEVPAGPSPAPDGGPVHLQVGEPRADPPAWIDDRVAGTGGWNRYPPPRGTEAYRAASHGWLARRYPEGARLVDAETQILPLPGTREGLFFAALAARRPGKDVVLLPNPFYHVYAGAAVAAGMTPLFVPATAATGFQPAYDSLDAATLERAAIAYVNSPSNPQGAVADTRRLWDTIALARRHDILLALDECYADIHAGSPPPGGLDAAAHHGADLSNVLVFHSLSKRSSAPGLRCGFATGDRAWLDALDATLRVGGAGVSLPVLNAGAALWADDAHAAGYRERYDAAFAAAARALGDDLVRPAGGFFLWLDVGDSEAAAVRLWRRAGIRVLPGAYMSVPDAHGENPGASHIRVALVDAPDELAPILARLADVLWGDDAGAASA